MTQSKDIKQKIKSKFYDDMQIAIYVSLNRNKVFKRINFELQSQKWSNIKTSIFKKNILLGIRLSFAFQIYVL